MAEQSFLRLSIIVLYPIIYTFCLQLLLVKPLMIITALPQIHNPNKLPSQRILNFFIHFGIAVLFHSSRLRWVARYAGCANKITRFCCYRASYQLHGSLGASVPHTCGWTSMLNPDLALIVTPCLVSALVQINTQSINLDMSKTTSLVVLYHGALSLRATYNRSPKKASCVDQPILIQFNVFEH